MTSFLYELYVYLFFKISDKVTYPEVAIPHVLLEPNFMSEVWHIGFQPYFQIPRSIL